MRTRKLALLGGALLAILPVVTTLPGCGGGSGGTVNIANRSFNNLPVELQDGRVARLSVTARGTNATGTLIVPNATMRQNARLPFNISGGTYTLTGTFTEPRTIILAGTIPVNGVNTTVSINGTVPTQTSGGTLDVTVNGVTTSVTLPPLSEINPTPTTTGTSPTPTSTTPQTGADSISITFSAPVGTNANTVAFASTNTLIKVVRNTPDFLLTTQFSTGASSNQRTLLIEGLTRTTPVTPGTIFSPGSTTNPIVFYSENSPTTGRSWQATGGTITVNSVSATTITLTLQNVTMRAQTGSSAVGTFTLNGTATLRL